MKTQEPTNKKANKPIKQGDQRDAGLAAENRPVPSQAEGDEETVDEDLARKGGKQ
jgi:hypothetical protein